MPDRCQKQGLYDPQFEHDNCGVGFVVNIKGKKSNQIVKQGLEVLNRLAHRGAVGADPETGDGAGILIQTPHDFFTAIFPGLPTFGNYGSGLIFLPTDEAERRFCKLAVEQAIKDSGQQLLGWRAVPIDNSAIGVTARQSEPVIEQIFIGCAKQLPTQLDFERKLYELRRQAEKAVQASQLKQKSCFYVTNISSRTFLYKGLLMPDQVEKFFVDLRDPRLASAIALVHSRYSTNTFPTWDLAQPFRFLAHNGEINTLRGNINWMKARGIDVIVPGGSDSAALDNVVEMLALSGRSLAHTMMMLIPQAWEHNKLMAKPVRDFYQYHTCYVEPWDGPAAVALTDGTRVGAVLDRNGLRPARYIVTNQEMVVMASEVGVLDIKAESIVHSGRLEPGKLFYIDTEKGRIINDEEIKEEISSAQPYGEWLRDNLVALTDLPGGEKPIQTIDNLSQQLKAFGYSREDLKVILKPMAEEGKEPIGSMGNDTPLAILSKKPQLLYFYFKQLFAQVTNPAIDPIREELVMSLESYLGGQKSIFEATPQHCHKLLVNCPILTNQELAKIKDIKAKDFKTKTISLLFLAGQPAELKARLDQVCLEAEEAIKAGYSFVILSDRGVDEKHSALPALLATGAVHHHLLRRALRTKTALLLESAEPREVHHFALLFGYGIDCVNPYLAYEAISLLVNEKEVTVGRAKAEKNYIHAVELGIFKILSKMGISTLHSYRGAQIFEALGVGEEVVDHCFAGTPSRIGGVDFKTIALEVLARHTEAFPKNILSASQLASGGVYQWKRDGEFHLWNPESIAALQDAVRKEDYARFQEFSRLINDQSDQPTTLRSLLKFKNSQPIPLAEVEPAESILKRFATGAMSFGSISRGAHETLALAMNRLGGRSNTGEGGEDPDRFRDERRSSIKQVASGRFGVTTNYLVNADELQIKIAQGAKPGEGGQLPGHKVSSIIAKTRYTTPGVTLISPPPHHDIYSIEDLAQLIFDLKNVNPSARISVKLVSEVGVGTVAAGVAKGHADMILISGGDGGTGASPISSIKNAGLPWELGLSETHQTLVLNDLRSRVRLQTDGQMRTGRDVAIAALLGAEEFGFCTAALIVMGCVMLRHCHLNNCSVGVATQDEYLSNRFSGRPEYVINFMRFVTQELREIMAQLGIRTLDEMIGRTDLLEFNRDLAPWKAGKIDYSKILYKPEVSEKIKTKKTIEQNHGVDQVLDRQLIVQAKPALESGAKIAFTSPISNINRTTGAMLSGALCKKYGDSGLPEDTIQVKFNGIAGQSFGAWLARGVTFELEGLANDYVGKGISGGKIIIYPNRQTTYQPEENIIMGNTSFYGAIAGEAYIRGVAGERFCIRNSGLYAVVEGVGDHGCEYMTGGRVVVLGPTGRNFAAGMSGGVAYVYDLAGRFASHCNLEMVELEKPTPEDEQLILRMLERHRTYTGSTLAANVIDDYAKAKSRFVKVMPLEYKRILAASADQTGVSDG